MKLIFDNKKRRKINIYQYIFVILLLKLVINYFRSYFNIVVVMIKNYINVNV